MASGKPNVRCGHQDAQIFDGTGSAPVHGDLSVTGGGLPRSAASSVRPRETVKADGLARRPASSTATHYDAQITWDPFIDPSPALGVTTAIMGNCGFTIAPCKPTDRDLTIRHLTHVEGMSLDALRAGIHWGSKASRNISTCWSAGIPANVACFSGHSAIPHLRHGRGRRADRDRRRIARMVARRCARPVAAGAIGSPPRPPRRATAKERRIPSRLADDRELRAGEAMGDSCPRRLHADQGSKTSVDLAYLEGFGRPEARRPVV